jgi:hypothetical protein
MRESKQEGNLQKMRGMKSANNKRKKPVKNEKKEIRENELEWKLNNEKDYSVVTLAEWNGFCHLAS